MKRSVKAEKTAPASSSSSPAIEAALLSLEDACIGLLDTQFAHEREDIEFELSERRLKNLVSRVSLALRECKGPRHFHQHYRHQKEDDSVLVPVLDDPLETLAQVCKSALAELQSGFAGSQPANIVSALHLLETALRKFIESMKNL